MRSRLFAISNLSTKISLVFGGSILVVIVTMVAIWYYGFAPLSLKGARDQRISDIIATQSIQADARIRQLANDLRERRGNLQVLANAPVFGVLLGAQPLDPAALQQALENAFTHLAWAYPDRYASLVLISADGRRLLTAPAATAQPPPTSAHWLDKVLTPGASETVMLNRDAATDALLLILARQIRSPTGGTLGTLVLRMPPGDLLAPLARADEVLLGPSGRIDLIDGAGTHLAHQTPRNATRSTTLPPPSAKSRGIEGSFLEPRPDGRTDIATYRYLQVGADDGWTLVVRRDKDEAFEYIVDRRNRVLLLSLVVAALSIVLVRLFARQLTRPLRALIDTSERIAAGEASVRMPPSMTEHTEELARLARSFNHMAAQVDSRRQRLEIEVDQRTEELAREKATLQRYLDVAGAIMLVLSPTGRIQLINRIGCEIVGRSEAELVGGNWFELCLPPRMHADVQAAFGRLVGGERNDVSRYENPILTADGQERTIAWANTLLRNPDGRITGILASGLDVTDARNAEAAVRSAHDLLHTIIDTSPDWICAKDREQRYILVNQAMASALGQSPKDMIGQAAPDPGIATAQHRDDNSDDKVLTGKSIHLRTEHIRDKAGRERILDTYKRPLRDAHGQINGLLAYSRDTTAQHEMEAQLRLWAKVFECSSEGVMITDPQHRIVAVNRAFSDITGYADHEAIGQTPRLLSSGRHDAAFYNTLRATMEASDRWQGEIWNRRKNGEVYPQWLTINAVRDPTGTLTHFAGVFSDISDIKRSEARLAHLAHHDALTGLPNRMLLHDRLGHSIERARRHQHSLAVCFLDLDNFKHVNDSLGHHVGDELLKAIATELLRHIRSEDTLSRIGGDEFVLLVDTIDTPASVKHIVNKLLSVLREPRNIAGHQLYLSGSVGISLFPQDGTDAGTLIQHADSAMYDAKQLGKNRFRFYTQSLTDGAVKRLRIESALREAALHQQLTLAYQPQVDLETGALIGVEALLRWTHPEMGSIPPDVFIPIAEESGLIDEIGAWVLNTACQQLSDWDAQGWSPPRMAVNVSVRQLRQPDLPNQVQSALDRARLPAARLELEITESAIADHDGVAAIHRLAALGVPISVDDFGTGYSSLSYLKKLPIRTLKIDKSFVADLTTDTNDEAIVRSVIALAGDLGLDVIAEGVELEAHRRFLLDHGCARGQGYLFDRPLSAEVLRQRYRAAAKKPTE
ncbi:MAG: EAL domain-containing protein [Denitromonas halophila]|nr:MAG: EAL domain-containing protein [Denitromonas halophila]TVT69152.1 MAG: EAL domain-containing protein [Denitromonas halophila]